MNTGGRLNFLLPGAVRSLHSVQPAHLTGRPTRWAGRLLCCLAVAAAAGVWLVLLPWLARSRAFEERWERATQAGIDPRAMFYSELPVAETIYADVEARLQAKSTTRRDRIEAARF